MNRYHGNKRIAARMFAKYGWGARQMPPLVKLWNRESGWRTHAANLSGAYGIPQALPGRKMASAGPHWRTSATTLMRMTTAALSATAPVPRSRCSVATWG